MILHNKISTYIRDISQNIVISGQKLPTERIAHNKALKAGQVKRFRDSKKTIEYKEHNEVIFKKMGQNTRKNHTKKKNIVHNKARNRNKII